MQFLPIDLFDPWAVLEALAIAGVLFFLMRFFTRRCQINEIEEFAVINVTMAFSLTLLIEYWRIDQVTGSDVLSVFILTIIFYASVLLASIAFGIREIKAVARPAARQAILSDPLRNPAIVIAFIAALPVIAFVAVKLIQSGNRHAVFGIARDLGAARLMMEGFAPIFFYFAISTAILGGWRRNIWLINPMIALQALGGSKGALISVIVTFFSLRGLLVQEMNLKSLDLTGSFCTKRFDRN